MCGGGKGTQQTTSQQMAAPNPAAMAAYNQAMARINEATSQPFQKYSSDPNAYVAPLTGTQTGAISNITGMAGMTDPYYQAAAGATAYGAGPVGRLTSEQIGEYMSPYMSQVADPVKAAMEQQFGQQLSQQQAQAIKSGAFGGERAGVERALLRGQQGLALGQALSPLYQTGYGQALQTAQGQQGIEAQNLQRMMSAGAQFGNLGSAAQQAALQQAQAQLQGGTLQQQTDTARLQALYNEFQKQRMYPLQVAQIQAQAAGALGPLMGSYQQTMQPQPFFGGIFADGGSVDGYGEGLGRARMGGAVHEGGDYSRGGYAYGGESDLSGLVEQQRAALGLGMPKEDIQVPMMQMTPGRAPEISAPPARREPGLVSKAISSYAEDPERLGKTYESGKEALGKAKDIFGFLSGSSSPLPSSFSGYADGGGVDSEDAAMQSILSNPIKTSDPLKPQDAPEKQKSGLGSLIKTGASMAANYFLPGSGAAVSAGLGALGMADGGRAGYEEGGDIFERGILGAESGRRQFDREGRVLTSPKGALGIAQILESTAPEAAKLAGVPYDPARLRSDEKYNASLGRAYYNEQLRKFGTPELAAAAYNAGPGRVQQALRRAEATGRDVMSFLPAETRDYVPRVMRMGGEGGIGAAREGIASVRREIPPGDPRREMMAMYPDRPTTEAPGPSAGLGSAQVKDESFLERTEKHPESLILPVLKGLGAMAGSRSRYLGSAVLEGLGAGAGSYMDMAAKQAEIDKMRQSTATEAEETRARNILGTKIGEETGEIQARTAGEIAKIASDPFIKGPDGQIIGIRAYKPGSNYPERVDINEYLQNPSKYLLAPAGGPGATMTPPAGAGAAPAPSGGEVATPKETTAPPAAEQAPPAVSDEDRKLKELADKYKREATGQGRTWFQSYPDIYTPQQQKAEAARELRTQFLPMAEGLSSLPKTGKQSPGAIQSVLAPVIDRVNSIARSLNFSEPFDPNVAASAEEARKYFTRLSAAATAKGDFRAAAALETLSAGYPSSVNSPKGLAKLLAGVAIESRLDIEKNDFYQKFKNLAERGTLGSQVVPLRSGAWADLGTQFDKDRAPKIAKDKQSLEKIFYESPALDKEHTKFLDNEGRVTTDPEKATTWGAWIIKNSATMTPEQKKFIEAQFGKGILSYFGM